MLWPQYISSAKIVQSASVGPASLSAPDAHAYLVMFPVAQLKNKLLYSTNKDPYLLRAHQCFPNVPVLFQGHPSRCPLHFVILSL
jgi:hypothetical protein